MKTKSQITLKAAVEILIGITILLLFIYAGKTWGNGEAIHKARIARESALLIDSMLATQGNIFVRYPIDVSKFRFHLVDDYIDVYKIVDDPTKGTYQFIGMEKADQKVLNPKNLILAKINDNLTILDDYPNLDKLKCSNEEIDGQVSSENILINPIYDNPGKIRKLNTLALRLSSSFRGNSITTFKDLESTEKEMTDSQIQKFIEDNNMGIIVNLGIGDYPDLRNTIKIYYPYESQVNERLACLIANELLDKDLSLGGISIVPTNLIPMFNDNKDRKIIQIELGNIQIKENNMLDSETPSISEAIVEGMTKLYYPG